MKFRSPFLTLAFVAALHLGPFVFPAQALITTTWNAASGNWDNAANWVGGVLPWENAGGDVVVDFIYGTGTVMTVNTAPNWTGAQFGANNGTPFQVRRVTVGGGRTLEIVEGGELNFSGAADTRLVVNSTGSALTVNGGVLKSTRSNLGGINLGGSHGAITFSGSSEVSIFDAGAAVSGMTITNAGAAVGPIHVIGSQADLAMEAITFVTTTTNNAKFRFTLDAGGASAFQLTNAFDLSIANTAISLQLYLETGLLDAPETITLFDLTNGSVGAFDEIVTSRGTFSATEGSIVEIASEADPNTYLEYKLTYALNGSDIGLLAVPEPSAWLLVMGGLTMVTILRRRR